MFARFRRLKSRKNVSLVPCPHCGGEISADATFCRHCGSSDTDGWSDESYDDADDFDYDQFVEDNFSKSRTSTTLSPLWRSVAIMIVVGFVLSMLAQLI